MGTLVKKNPKLPSHATHGPFYPTDATLRLCFLCLLLFKASPCFLWSRAVPRFKPLADINQLPGSSF
jgi:hypothetical protein